MERKSFLKILASIPIMATGLRLNAFGNMVNEFPSSLKMPVIFIGHGHPINALLDNNFTQAITRLGERLEKPKAIMVVSAHWQTKGSFVSANPQPKAIYDFKGLDERLFQIKYEPKGCPKIAKEVTESVRNNKIQEAQAMGLDHGAWTVLKHLYPKADVPVFQLSLDSELSPGSHFRLAGELKRMREKGVLIIGSGNVVHNLRTVDWNNINARALDWAVYALGLGGEKEGIKYLFEGFQFGSASMRSFQIG